jgi:hypothetical protein
MPSPFPSQSVDPEEGLRAAGIMLRYLATLEGPLATEAKPKASKPKPPMLTEPLTRGQLAKYFACHRNAVQTDVLERYAYEVTGNKRPKYRMHVTDMPPAYLTKHKATL